MTTTAKDIILGAIGRRTANDPGKLALKQELIGVLSRRLQSISGDMVSISPFFFGAAEEVTPTDAGWPEPAAAIVVTYIERVSDDTEVARTTLLDKTADEGLPRVYEYGRYWFSVGEEGDPLPETEESGESVAGTPLRFYFAKRLDPLAPTAAWDSEENTLDPLWPEHRNKLLEAEVALYMAKKDGRTADFSELEAEIKEERALLSQEALIRHEYNKSKRWSERPRLG